MLAKRLIKSNDAGGGCTNTVDLYNPFPDGGGLALYQLNGDATDVSGNYDGTASNVTYGTGQFGQAAQFNGSNSYVLIADSPALRLTGDYAISFWFKTNSIGAIQRLVNKDNANDFSGGWALVLEPDSSITWVHNNGSTNQNWNTGVSITANTWYYVTAVYSDSNNLRSFYLNGSLQNTITTNTNVASETDVLLFGAYGQSSPLGQYFNGSLDQVRIFNRALRPYEVEALYTEEYCTPTIVPSEHFNAVTYTGDGGTQSVTSVGFQSDLVWLKSRDTGSHFLHDSVRGINNNYYYSLISNATHSESVTDQSWHDAYGRLSDISSNGFTVVAGSNAVDTDYNKSGEPYVAWNFKAGGAAVTNTDGTITSQVSANTEAGFSIVSYTGNGTAGATVGHGLGVEPSIVIFKNRDLTSNWAVYSNQLGVDYTLFLNTTDAKISVSGKFSGTNNNVIGLNSAGDVNLNSIIAHCFAEVEGFSSFGSYDGTGASGNTVITGFEPAFVMMKASNDTSDWFIVDNKRNLNDPRNSNLRPNNSNAESNAASGLNFLENGFEFTGAAFNDNNVSWIYMAFAADPTTVEPSLEDSFNTVLYTGNGGTQSVTGVGFQPDLVWVKNRQSPPINTFNLLFDSVRGATKWLSSNATNAEGTIASSLTSFNSDGFSLGTDPVGGDEGWNINGNEHVAWAWKGAELPAINSNGSIPSVVSANPAAGFSISTYNGKTGGGTTGHGLNSEPEFIIFKRYTAAQNWFVFAKINNVWNVFEGLNTTAAATDYSPYFSANDSIINWYNANEYNSDPASSYLAYSFHSVAGFSKFGSYTGTGGSTTVSGFGFEPAFLLIKRTDTTGSWVLQDNARGAGKSLFPDLSAAESLGWQTTFNSDGFNTTSGEAWINANGGTYIYMAFANQF